jgi:hypothetical protein
MQMPRSNQVDRVDEGFLVSSIGIKKHGILVEDIQVGWNSQLACGGAFDGRLLSEIGDFRFDWIPRGLFFRLSWSLGVQHSTLVVDPGDRAALAMQPIEVSFTRCPAPRALRRSLLCPLGGYALTPGMSAEWSFVSQVVGRLVAISTLPEIEFGRDVRVAVEAHEVKRSTGNKLSVSGDTIQVGHRVVTLVTNHLDRTVWPSDVVGLMDASV